jgi:serine/threonine protein kinase
MTDYQFLFLLGTGHKASVRSAIRRTDGLSFAIKSFPPEMEAQARKEFETARLFTHPHLLRPEAFIQDGIVLPYCKGRSVECLAGTVSESVAWQLLGQIASALDYLQERGYCHGSVCPGNILWDGDHFLLADFGMCHPAPGVETRNDPEDFRFVAPEGPMDESSDVWSLGATVFTLVLGNPVFNGLGGKAQQPDSPVPYLRKAMPELSDLLCRCLAFDPKARPSPALLSEEAETGLRQCLDKKPQRPLKPMNERAGNRGSPEAGFWPDPMIDS